MDLIPWPVGLVYPPRGARAKSAIPRLDDDKVIISSLISELFLDGVVPALNYCWRYLLRQGSDECRHHFRQETTPSLDRKIFFQVNR